MSNTSVRADERATQRAAFWREVAQCKHCDPRGWIDAYGHAGNITVHRCARHDWQTKQPGGPRTLDMLADADIPPGPDLAPEFPHEFTPAERLSAYWYALRAHVTIARPDDWRTALRRSGGEGSDDEPLF